MRTNVAIIGAGLAGLCAARRLHATGLDVVVIEARERLGGRILSVDATGRPAADGFDLGPSWFWPHAQPDIAALVRELGVPSFPQHDDGDVIFERMSREAAWRVRPTSQAAQSMRVVGGTGALITALATGLPGEHLWTGTRVESLTLEDGHVRVTTSATGGTREVQALHVIAALPPRLLAALSFSPPVDADSHARWQDTATWMAPHAKFFALYGRPFWREAGLCGTAQSFVGPMGEVHDATTASGKAALFGFLGVGADTRASLGEAELTRACLAQLARLFGAEALHPEATLLKDWAADPCTATSRDRAAGGHPAPMTAPWVTGTWRERLSLCGSETSPVEPGFLSGAVHAAERAAREVIARLRTA